MIELTPEQEVEFNYNSAMDSVNLLNAGKPEMMSEEEWTNTINRNKEHLRIQIAKGEYYAGYDLEPFMDAV
jgi:hypothetical protein